MGSASLKVTEPSMEDILASIRRIIADDQEAPHPPEPEELVSSPLKNVLDIAELHVAPLLGSSPNEPVLGPWSRGEPQEVSFDDGFQQAARSERPVDIDEPEGFSIPPVTVKEPALKSATAPTPAEPAPAKILLSHEVTASVATAFDRLSASVRPSEPKTVEDLMKEMLRPMLKAWLDDHLPPLVEGLVRDEIERITRRRG
jgi:cell pole-organizing protein PopZ